LVPGKKFACPLENFAVFRRKLNSENIQANRREKEKERLYRLYGVNLDIIDRLKSEMQAAAERKKELLSLIPYC
jgi:hypothetical protein